MRKTDRMRQGLILAGPELAVKEKPARLTQAGWGDECEGPLGASLGSQQLSLRGPERGHGVVIALQSVLAPVINSVTGKLLVAAPPQGLITLSHFP